MRFGSYGSIPIRPSARRRLIVPSDRTIGAILWRGPFVTVCYKHRSRAVPGCSDCGKVLTPVSMLYPPLDPNERFRQRRSSARRRKRLQRSALIAVLLALVAAFGLGAQLVGGGGPE